MIEAWRTLSSCAQFKCSFGHGQTMRDGCGQHAGRKLLTRRGYIEETILCSHIPLQGRELFAAVVREGECGDSAIVVDSALNGGRVAFGISDRLL